MPGHRNGAWLGRVLVYTVTPSRAYAFPAIITEFADDVTNLHESKSSGDGNLSADALQSVGETGPAKASALRSFHNVAHGYPGFLGGDADGVVAAFELGEDGGGGLGGSDLGEADDGGALQMFLFAFEGLLVDSKSFLRLTLLNLRIGIAQQAVGVLNLSPVRKGVVVGQLHLAAAPRADAGGRLHARHGDRLVGGLHGVETGADRFLGRRGARGRPGCAA